MGHRLATRSTGLPPSYLQAASPNFSSPGELLKFNGYSYIPLLFVTQGFVAIQWMQLHPSFFSLRDSLQFNGCSYFPLLFVTQGFVAIQYIWSSPDISSAVIFFLFIDLQANHI